MVLGKGGKFKIMFVKWATAAEVDTLQQVSRSVFNVYRAVDHGSIIAAKSSGGAYLKIVDSHELDRPDGVTFNPGQARRAAVLAAEVVPAVARGSNRHFRDALGSYLKPEHLPGQCALQNAGAQREPVNDRDSAGRAVQVGRYRLGIEK